MAEKIKNLLLLCVQGFAYIACGYCFYSFAQFNSSAEQPLVWYQLLLAGWIFICFWGWLACIVTWLINYAFKD